MATDQQEHLKIEQLHEASPNDLEVAAGRERENLEGWIPELASPAEIIEALEKAFDYRGNVTLTLRDHSEIQGYIFDRRTGANLLDSVVRIIPLTSREKLSIRYADIAAIAFTGRDTAAGKTFEAWVKKYWEKKDAGEKNIQIVPDRLD